MKEKETTIHSLTDLVGSIAVKQGLPKATVKRVLCDFLDTTAATVLDGGRIVVRGFGSFYLADHINHAGGRNERVAFKAGTDLRRVK